MDRFNKISDEELGAYLDGMLPGEDSAKIDAAMDMDTLEVLKVSRKAMDEMPSDNIISMPSWMWGSVASVCSACSPPDAADFISDASMDDDDEE